MNVWVGVRVTVGVCVMVRVSVTVGVLVIVGVKVASGTNGTRYGPSIIVGSSNKYGPVQATVRWSPPVPSFQSASM